LIKLRFLEFNQNHGEEKHWRKERFHRENVNFR